MATTPYRTTGRSRPRADAPPGPVSLVGVAAIVWIGTVARVALAVAEAEPLSRELALAGLVLVGAPLVAWKETAARR
jgi:hypothetical protein